MSRALLLALLLGACAQPLSKLTPFPCAGDGTCPGGLACVPGVGCSFPQRDALCGPETDCATAGLTCLRGVCTSDCAATCGPGRVCSAPGAGACLADCTSGEACPGGLSCTPLWYGGKKGCLPASESVAACAGVDSETALACDGSSFTVNCANGTRCAAHSACAANNTCECEPGYLPWQCKSGERCGVTACAYPNWWCLPVGIDGACATSGGYQPGTWRCVDGRRLPATCGSDCETACRQGGGSCDPVAQACGAPETKCTLFTTDAGVDTRCVAPGGAVMPGAPCTRDAGSPWADDDCAAGSLCSAIGEPGAPTCHRFCRHTSDCAGGACMQVSDRVPPDGVCVGQCALFAPCTGGRACSVEKDLDDRVVSQCRGQVATATLDAPCTAQPDCAADLLCLLDGAGGAACKALCDATHPCPDGGPCATFVRSELPAGTGFCR